MKTLLASKQQAIKALKTKLRTMDATRNPSAFAKKAAELRKLEKDIEKRNEPEIKPDQATHQIEQILNQLATANNEERGHLVNQIAKLAGWPDGDFPSGDPDAEELLNKIVVAMETAHRAQRKTI